LPRDWWAAQDLDPWTTRTWACDWDLPVWCIADQNSGGPVSGMRQYYLTQNETYVGSQPDETGACAVGYHLASLWETLDPSNLRYNVNLGQTRMDAGMGPPGSSFGWVRTGYVSDDGAITDPGQANCSAWTSGSAGNYGTVVELPSEWKNTDEQDVSVWTAALRECSQAAPAWCVADALDGAGTCSIPRSIACGAQVSGSTAGLASHHGAYSCSGWDESGPEVVYSLRLPAALAPYTVTATLTNLGEDLDVFILAPGQCGAGTCAAGSSYGDTSATLSSGAGGTYYIAIDGYNGATSGYTLSVDCKLRTAFLPLAIRGQ
jgi:hypothetical protein